MLHEINANAALPAWPIHLRADAGDQRGVIDGGPEGFALLFKLEAGDPVEVRTYGSKPGVFELRVGETMTIGCRAEFRTLGIQSWVRVRRDENDGSRRAQNLKAAA